MGFNRIKEKCHYTFFTEDGRKKRKRKVVEAVDSPTHSSTPSPAMGSQHPTNQMVATFNPQPQLQQQQQDSQQMQQQQQHMYQSNPNQVK